MGLEIVVGLAALAILAVIAITVIGMGTQLLRTAEARTELVEGIASGAQPPSLHPRIDPALCMGSGMCVEVCPESDVLQVLDGQVSDLDSVYQAKVDRIAKAEAAHV